MSFTVNYTGDEVEYTVPNGVEYLRVQAWGGQGGHVFLDAPTGHGGYVDVTFAVSEGQVYHLFAGQSGEDENGGDGLGRVNGANGGHGLTLSGGGGGAGSYVSLGDFVNTDACFLVVGGGGGSGTVLLSGGGDGGGNPGQDGNSSVLGEAGHGANNSTAGAGGVGLLANGSSGSGGNGGLGALLLGLGLVGGGGGGGGYRGGGGGGMGVAGAGAGAGNGYIHGEIPVVGTPINVRFGQEGYEPNNTDDGRMIVTPLLAPCIAEGSLVKLANGREMPIENLRAGQCVVGVRGQPIQVERVVRFDLPARQFVQIEAGSLGHDAPAQNLLIRPGHPMLIAGKEVVPEQLIGRVSGINMVRLEQPVKYYTLLTGSRTFVDVQGLMVATWSTASWDNAQENSGLEVGRFEYF